MPGYISLHRDIQKHWLYEEVRVFSRYEAWLDILMRVNHAEGKVTHNGTVETVLRGSTIWSMGDMEKHWGWSNKKVKRFLLCLVSDQMLSVKSTTKKTYLTVINYDKYQGSDIDKAPPTHHQSTTEAFQKHNESIQTIITNNVNNENNLTATTKPPEIILQDEFCRIHNKGSWTLKQREYKHFAEITSIDIPMEFIFSTMTKMHEHKQSKNEKVTSFSFYYQSIIDAWNAKKGGIQSASEIESRRHAGTSQYIAINKKEASGVQSESSFGGHRINSEYDLNSFVR